MYEDYSTLQLAAMLLAWNGSMWFMYCWKLERNRAVTINIKNAITLTNLVLPPPLVVLVLKAQWPILHGICVWIALQLLCTKVGHEGQKSKSSSRFLWVQSRLFSRSLLFPCCYASNWKRREWTTGRRRVCLHGPRLSFEIHPWVCSTAICETLILNHARVDELIADHCRWSSN